MIRKKPDAIVFIPGMGRPWEVPDTHRIVDGLSDRLTVALERNTTSSLRYSTEYATRENSPGQSGPTRIASIHVTNRDDGSGNHLLELFVLDLVEQMVLRDREASTKKRMLYLGIHILFLVPRMVRALTQRRKELRDQIQLILGAGTIMILLVGFLSLLATMVAGFIAL